VAPASLQVLIDINRHIAMGLSGSTSDGQAARPAAPAPAAQDAKQGLGRFVA
jgi:20S proteasome alpha/beta subunit